VQNFLLIWVDANIDQTNKDCQNTLKKLRSVVNDVNICTEPEQCIQCLKDIDKEKAFIIASGSLGQHLVPNIHAMPQVDAIYIFCGNKSRHEEWTKKWVKIKGIHTDIKPICEALQLAAKQCNEDSVAMSFVAVGEGASSENLNQLEPTFMYTQIFKEILLDMKHDPQAIKDLANYCRGLHENNVDELMIIDEFEQNYRSKSAIWWYTRECFTYQMLNRALRTLEGDTIINMGFFIHDLHRQIEELHRKQIGSYQGKSFTVYRGQGLLAIDFQKIRKTKGGLISFNSFLSTSEKREVSFEFAERALGKSDMVGILFRMSIDPSVSSAPFAAIKEVSYFQTENEILFSMHTVFRIGDINKMDKNNLLYQVELKLTADDDQQLRTLTERIREDAGGGIGWARLGALLAKIGHFDKAEELYTVLVDQTSDQRAKAAYYNNLGYIKNNQGDYKKAIWYYEKGLDIEQKILTPNHPSLATSYGNIGLVYRNMEDYSKALSFFEKTIEIKERYHDPGDPSFATSYNSIGALYDDMKEYSKALSFYEKALEILQKTLPPNHPHIAASYSNIGLTYDNMGEYLKALSFYEKALEIERKTLPPNHPNLAISYNNIGWAYYSMKEYSKALSYFERALDIWQRSLPPTHPQLQKVQNNIQIVKKSMK
jgi:tetratricopeptide (TPR) repeat protein